MWDVAGSKRSLLVVQAPSFMYAPPSLALRSWALRGLVCHF